MPAKGKKVVPKKKANGYKMPAPIRLGEVINDTVAKKKWRIGPSIGVGGFGEIYSACQHEGSPKKGSSYPFVVKIEPHENGPLFVEKHFYIRNANKDDITKYMKDKKLSSLGMPTYFGNGSHDYNGEKYRYLVLERYGKDVWSLFKECGRSFPTATVFLLGLQMLDVLEYIHNRGYVHADVKGANILMGLKKGTENQAYLVDFGLATRLNDKEFKPDPRSAHNGTIEYTSRDAHLGVPTMRGDLEILGYNMLQWLVGELPWEKSLQEPKNVQAMKEAFIKSVRSNITKQYKNVPDALIKFFEYIATLKPKDTPDYTKCRQLFESYLKSEGKTRSSKMEFTPNKKVKNVNKQTVEDETDGEEENQKENGDAPKKRGRPKVKTSNKKPIVNKQTVEDNTDGDEASPEEESLKEEIPKENSDALKKRNRRLKVKTPVTENYENEQPDDSIGVSKTKKKVKRKSSEPVMVTKVKKIKLTPKATPPAKKNHANMATQTSIERRRSPRQVSFDSPISEVIGEKSLNATRSSTNTSGDIFEDSFVIEEKKMKRKRKLLSDQTVTVKKVVRKKVTTVKKGKSWKDIPSVVNGRSPPK